MERVLQYSEALCCTWDSSCNIRGCFVARGACLAIFGVLCCTWTSSCNIRGCFVARVTRLATFGYSYCHFLQNVSTIISQQHHNYALPYTSFTTSPDFLPRYSIHTNIYIKKDLFVWIRKRKVLFLIKFIYSFFVFYFFGILNI